MHLSEFAAVSQKADALIVLDAKTDALKTYGRDRFSRLVQWVRDKISPNRHVQLERDGALMLFMTAIADHAAYDSGDKERASALLTCDVTESQPLTSRRIREVMQDLDERSTQAERDNRVTASYMGRRGVDMRLRDEHPGVKLSPADRTLLSDRIREAVDAAGRDGRHKVAFAEATAITDSLVDELVAHNKAVVEAEARAAAEAEARAVAEAEARAVAQAAANVVAQGDAGKGSGIVAGGAGSPAGNVRSARSAALDDKALQEPPTKRQLLRTLAAADLPRDVHRQVNKAVNSGDVADRGALVRDANRSLADWVIEHRIGRWWGEAQIRHGLASNIRNNAILDVSSTLVQEMSDSIAHSTELRPYQDIKARARVMVDARMTLELDQKAV